MRRTAARTFAAVLATALVATGLGLLSTPAEARSQQRFVVRNGVRTSADYPEFIRDLPQSSVGAPDPAQCVAAEHCDTIPVQIDIPTNIGKGDDYFVELVVEWDDKFTDLDIFLWDDTQTKEKLRKNPGEDGYTPDQTTSDYTQVANDTERRPATLLLKEPRLVNYNLVVLNYAGGGFGGASGAYHVRARMIVNVYTPPEEYKDDDPISSTDSDDIEDEFATTESDDPLADITGGDANNPFGNLGNVHVACDPLLCRIGDSDINDDLKRPLPVDVPRLAEAVAESPGAAVLILWLVVLPALLALGGAFLLRRRRLSAFTGM